MLFMAGLVIWAPNVAFNIEHNVLKRLRPSRLLYPQFFISEFLVGMLPFESQSNGMKVMVSNKLSLQKTHNSDLWQDTCHIINKKVSPTNFYLNFNRNCKDSKKH